jgi:hypothetical protein
MRDDDWFLCRQENCGIKASEAAAIYVKSLERQIVELRAERDNFAVTVVNLANQRDAAEADRARLSEAIERALQSLCGDYPSMAADLRAALSSSGAGGWRPTHRHKKRGSEYMLLGIGKMQAERWYLPGAMEAGPSVDMEEVVIYRGEDGKLWVRPREEFEDGRFEDLPATPQPKGE